MNLVKNITDYSKTPFENELAKFISLKLDSAVCVEKIKNIDFMIKYIQPINDFIIYDNSICGCNIKKTN